MKKKIFFQQLSVLFLFLSSVFVFSNESKYAQELQDLKQKTSYDFLFAKDKNQQLQIIRRDMKIYKNLTAFQRFVRSLFIACDSIVVTEKNMPQLYNYVSEICEKADIDKPVIFVQRKKSGILNAFAQKLLMSSGGILLTQDLLFKCTEKEVEAIVAHEIGHIKYNHVNKSLPLFLIGLIASFYPLYESCNNYLKEEYEIEEFDKVLSKVYLKGSVILCLVRIFSSLLIGKRFESQADEFACKMGKAEGIVQFFERMVEKEELAEQDFIFIKGLLEQKKERLGKDYSKFKLAYWGARFNHSIDKAFKWLYYNTRLGAHPSDKERIKRAQEYLAKQQVA